MDVETVAIASALAVENAGEAFVGVAETVLRAMETVAMSFAKDSDIVLQDWAAVYVKVFALIMLVGSLVSLCSSALLAASSLALAMSSTRSTSGFLVSLELAEFFFSIKNHEKASRLDFEPKMFLTLG